MKTLTAFINARLQSSRLENKMTRPFGDTCLLRLGLERLNRMTWATRRFFCIAEEELAEYARGLDNVEILWRDKSAVSRGDTDNRFAHYAKLPTPWFMFVNASHPFVSLESYRKAWDVFQATDFNAYTSVTRKKAWVFDADGEPLTLKDPRVTSTKDGGYSYEANHAFHIANKDFFLRTGQHWEMKKDSPHVIEIPGHEALDIDTPLDFHVCETLYRAGYPKGFLQDGAEPAAPAAAEPAPAFRIGPHDLTRSARVLAVAEVGCAHGGDVDTAHAFVDAAADIGADVVKFQTHIADAESTIHDRFRTPIAGDYANRKEYWRAMEFSETQWRALKEHADRRGILFMSSPFSNEAVDLLERVGVPAWKVGAGELTNDLLLGRMADTGLPVLLSTGMTSWTEIDHAAALFRDRGAPFALLQCSSLYPCPPEQAGLNNLHELRKRYGVPVGFSSHSPEITQCLAAACYGAQIVEFHITLPSTMDGIDAGSSLTVERAAELVRHIRAIEVLKDASTNKDVMAYDLAEMRSLFFKSVVPRVAIPAGAAATPDMLTVKKPGTGIPAGDFESLIGRRVKRNLEPDEVLSHDDFE